MPAQFKGHRKGGNSLIVGTATETETSFKGGFGLNVCCGKANRVNLCFKRISMMAQGDLKKGFEGFDFTSLFHLDW